MTSISIARALVELKTLDSRINKTIDSTQWILYKTKGRNSSMSEEEYKKATHLNFNPSMI